MELARHEYTMKLFNIHCDLIKSVLLEEQLKLDGLPNCSFLVFEQFGNTNNKILYLDPNFVLPKQTEYYLNQQMSNPYFSDIYFPMIKVVIKNDIIWVEEYD